MRLKDFVFRDTGYEAVVSFDVDTNATYLFDYNFKLQRIECDKPVMKKHPYTPKFEKELFALIADWVWCSLDNDAFAFTCFGYKDTVSLYLADAKDFYQAQYRDVLVQIDEENYCEIGLNVTKEYPGGCLVDGYFDCIVKSSDLAKIICNREKAREIASSDGCNRYDIRNIEITWGKRNQ